LKLSGLTQGRSVRGNAPLAAYFPHSPPVQLWRFGFPKTHRMVGLWGIFDHVVASPI